MNRRLVSAVLLALLTVGAIAAVGVYAYRFGLARGLEATGKLPAGPGGMPYSSWGYFHPFGFVFPLLFLFLIFAVARRSAWWGRSAGWRSWRQNLPEQLDEWHRKAHESMAGGKVG